AALPVRRSVRTPANRLPPRADPRILVIEHERDAELRLEGGAEQRRISRVDGDEERVVTIARHQGAAGGAEAGVGTQPEIAEPQPSRRTRRPGGGTHD